MRSALSDIILLAIRLGHVQSLRQAARVRDTLAKQMIAWIDRHLTEQVTLGDIAASASVSPRECQRIFRQLLHRSPMNYLNMRRLYAAADALVSSSAPITDIALAYGFTSPSYFAQQFHRLLSLTPREYRNQYSRPFGG